ncbi:NAD-dependent epimerase/dehydratase family protein [Aureispira anguillae]|uniref:NAD-dependent epimerase/dehydratase family protein n=1 Tax=Aureispira anguillae TaxID=2864201 RepID=A0A915YK46_9BACT|nr:NAD-dependent epimerase/dehydratase family protein [Aureispira anguillae]BDS14684.1 NAD-dependent epimerase/dehydratase family protein [Aureispira anguillae]
MTNKQVLVTGGTGFVGAYLLHYLLQKGYKVKAIKRKTSPMNLVADIQDQVEWLVGDILDTPFLEQAMKGVQQVYHAAAMISFHPKDAALMLKINAEGTANVVNAALYEKIEKMVHISSIAALGRKEYQPHIDEKAQWENSKENSNYAISKFKAECEVWRGMQEGLEIGIVNPSVIIGGGYWAQGSCRLIQRVAKGLKHYPQGATGFVDVRDVARAAIELMESPISGERYILNGANWSYQQFFEAVAQALGQTPPQKKAAAWMVNLLWRLEWFRSKLFRTHPILTKETARTSQSTYYYHNEKIINELNFDFTPIEKTIEDTALAFKKSQQEGKHFGLVPIR